MRGRFALRQIAARLRHAAHLGGLRHCGNCALRGAGVAAMKRRDPWKAGLTAAPQSAAASVPSRPIGSRPHLEHSAARAPGCADRVELTTLPTGLHLFAPSCRAYHVPATSGAQRTLGITGVCDAA